MQGKRFQVLDGWRGISILLVLATHLLPLGPKAWQLNSTSGPLGMALFFTLSGFLIAHFLTNHANVVDFLIRRLFRIVPLAWLYIAIALLSTQAGTQSWLAHLFFYANWPPMQLGPVTSHIWSLCVEVQFYLGIALLVALLRQRGLLLIPLLCLAFTLYRVTNEVHIAINTYYRVDEILAGSILALIYNNKLGAWPREFLRRVNPLLVLILLIVSCHPESGFMNYPRPYLAAILVGSTLFNNGTRMAGAQDNRVLFYIAAVSYALYVIHPLLAHTWLGSGEGWDKYAKRPLLFAALFALAHLSTFHFEHKWMAYGKRLAKRQQARATG
ncbi:MAG: acyltransferase [Pseudomonadota bacterium]|nr:acyltransferase [Pseudomonadota bacterium]